MARGLKFYIKEVEELYYLCSENKGADQLRGYREADLRLCFRIYKKQVFSRRGSREAGNYDKTPMQYNAIFHGCNNVNFQTKKCVIFLIFARNIDRGSTLKLEASTV